jgi:hypothetical protein
LNKLTVLSFRLGFPLGLKRARATLAGWALSHAAAALLFEIFLGIFISVFPALLN